MNPQRGRLMPNKDELRACWAFDEDWYMGWTTDRGLPRWIPMKIQEFIVLTWNRIVCRIKGHQIVGEIKGTLCSHCMHCTKETLGTGCRWCESEDLTPRRKR